MRKKENFFFFSYSTQLPSLTPPLLGAGEGSLLSGMWLCHPSVIHHVIRHLEVGEIEATASILSLCLLTLDWWTSRALTNPRPIVGSGDLGGVALPSRQQQVFSGAVGPGSPMTEQDSH